MLQQFYLFILYDRIQERPHREDATHIDLDNLNYASEEESDQANNYFSDRQINDRNFKSLILIEYVKNGSD